MDLYEVCPNGKRRKLIHTVATVSLPVSLPISFPVSLRGLDLSKFLDEVLFEIMKKLVRSCYVSYVHLKCTCKMLNSIGNERSVVHLRCLGLPINAEDHVSVERLMNVAIVAGNLTSLFRLGLFHLLCTGGDFMYGQHMILRVAYNRLIIGRYLCCLVLAARSYPPNLNLFGFGMKMWNSMYNEGRIHELRMQFSSWFLVLRSRLAEGPIFQVNPYACCYMHSKNNRKPWCCTRCKVDIELQWFVENLGGQYVTA